LKNKLLKQQKAPEVDYSKGGKVGGTSFVV
jgi:hypothetical protein